jgi:hypothetical protein
MSKVIARRRARPSARYRLLDILSNLDVWKEYFRDFDTMGLLKDLAIGLPCTIMAYFVTEKHAVLAFSLTMLLSQILFTFA